MAVQVRSEMGECGVVFRMGWIAQNEDEGRVDAVNCLSSPVCIDCE